MPKKRHKKPRLRKRALFLVLLGVLGIFLWPFFHFLQRAFATPPPERVAVAYVTQEDGAFVALDADGYVVFTTFFRGMGRPLLVGLTTTDAQTHTPVAVENPTELDIALMYVRAIHLYGLEQWVSWVDVSDKEGVRLRLFNLEVELGGGHSPAEMQEQVRFLAGLTADWSEVRVRSGVLDMRVVGGRYVLR